MSRRKISDSQVAQSGARWLSGESAETLAEELGVTSQALRRRWKQAGICRSQRVDQAVPPPPAGWGELIAKIAEAPDDPVEWASWVRRAFTAIAIFRLSNPSLPSLYAATLDEFRSTLSAAQGVRNEDLLADTLRKIKADADELDDTGPEVTDLAPRQHRRTGQSAPS